MKVGELVGTLAPLMRYEATILVYCDKEVLFNAYYARLEKSIRDRDVKSWRWTEHHDSSYLEIEVKAEE